MSIIPLPDKTDLVSVPDVFGDVSTVHLMLAQSFTAFMALLFCYTLGAILSWIQYWYPRVVIRQELFFFPAFVATSKEYVVIYHLFSRGRYVDVFVLLLWSFYSFPSYQILAGHVIALFTWLSAYRVPFYFAIVSCFLVSGSVMIYSVCFSLDACAARTTFSLK